MASDGYHHSSFKTGKFWNMITLRPDQVSLQLRTLFSADEPAGIRALAVLDGNMLGRVFTDDEAQPTWGVLQETVYGTIYLGGVVPDAIQGQLIADLRREGEVLIGLWQDDERIPFLLSLQPEYDGTVYDFFDRDAGQELNLSLPEGCDIRPVDAELYKRLADYDPRTAESALKKGIGFCLMRGDEILCEAFATRLTPDVMEMGVTTHKPYEGRGYGTLTCAHLVQACEAKGYQTYWNCNQQNIASLKIARKLGYRTEKAYRLLYWSGGQ
jgi:RimJ/RimL family protein N-acetyltransferase